MSEEKGLVEMTDVTVRESGKDADAKPNSATVENAAKVARAMPKLFKRNGDRVEIAVNGYHSADTGELMFVVPRGTDDEKEDFGDLFTRVTYRFWFTRVPYDKLNRYRSRSMIYNPEGQNNTINELRLREFFLVFHLVEWDLKDDDGNPIKLEFDPNKSLSDKTLEMIYTLPSNLLDVVLSEFEKRNGLA